MSAMRRLWSDPTFLAAITKMQPAGAVAVADAGAHGETAPESNGSSPPGGRTEPKALDLNGAGNGAEGEGPMTAGVVRYEASPGKGRGEDDDDGARSTRISTPNKRRLEDLPELKRLVPNPARRKKFGDWLKKNHQQGERGRESDVTRGGGGQDGHDHLSDDEVEDVVRQWQAEEGITEEEQIIRNNRDGKKKQERERR
jgi:hypothetical protein